jgi:hypothetical protein
MEVGKRYVEQLQTTVETMRRRLVATYDLGLKVGHRSIKLAERAREVGESAIYDAKDQLVQACSEKEPLDAQDRETRNNLVELYLGIAVLLIGLSSGQLSGTSILAPLLEKVFDPILEFALVFLLPVYVYLSFRKNAALDETERRVWLFGLAFAQGALLGHLVGPRLIRAVPAIFFLVPVAFALLTDFEISPGTLYSDRVNLLATCAAIGGGLSIGGVSLAAGLSFGTIVITLAHLAILFVHFQAVIQQMKSKTYGVSEAQLAYILSLVFAQILVSYLFISGGSNNEAVIN